MNKDNQNNSDIQKYEKITVVGLGPGNTDYITKKGIESIKKAEIAIGGKRQLDEIDEFLKEDCIRYTLKKLLEVITFIKSNRDKNIVVIVSGDTGFYSLLPFLRKHFLEDEVNVIPGISSFQYLFSKLGEAWHEYTPMSVHGREMDYIKHLKNSKGVVLLTDDKNTPFIIAKNLYDNGFRDLEIIVGERLSYEDENIVRVNIKEYQQLDRVFGMNIVVARKI